jgi:hypothetical protein
MAGITLEDMESYDDLGLTYINVPGWGDGTLWISDPGIEDMLDIQDVFLNLVNSGVIKENEDTNNLEGTALRQAVALWYEVILRCSRAEDGSPLFRDRGKGLAILKRKNLDMITSAGQQIFDKIFSNESGSGGDPKLEGQMEPQSSIPESTPYIQLPPPVATAQ